MIRKILTLLAFLIYFAYGAVSWTFTEDNTASPESNVTYMSNKALGVENTSPKTIHIVFRDYNGKLYHLKYDNNSWSKEEISADGNYSSIFVSANNDLHVSYFSQSDNKIKYAKYSSSWATENADSAQGNYTKIVTIGNNPYNPYIVYSKNGNLGVVYYDSPTGGWVDKQSSEINSAGNLDIAVDLNNKIHVVYYNTQTNDLNYTQIDSSGNFSNYKGIDSTGDVGKYPSIAVDLNNNLHVSYYDSTNKDLKYAFSSDGGDSWTTTTIDSDGDVGKYSSIAVDYNNNVFISYYDETNKKIKFATNVTGTWIAASIDSNTNAGQYTSIKVTDEGVGYISYKNVDTNKTRLAYKLVSLPKPPSNLSATAEDNQTIKLTWIDNSNNEDNFNIYRQKSGGNLAKIATVNADTTTYTDSGLEANTEYHYEVNATNDIGESNGTETNATTLKTPPAATSNITFSDINQTSVTINWNDNSTNEEGFHIYKNGELNATVAANSTSKQITGLNPNTTYTFIIGAYNNGGENNSSSVSVTTLKTPPAAPSNPAWTPLSPTSIKITWTDNSNNEENFIIYKDGVEIKSLPLNSTETNITGLNRDATYDFNISAKNNGGENNVSLNNVRIADKLPQAPTNLEANTTSYSSIKLGWTDNSDNEDGFYIYRKKGSGSFLKITTLPSNTTTYEDTGLQANTTYTYIVSAFNVVGENNSSQDNNTTFKTPPAAPNNITFTDINQTSVTIHWSDNSDNEDNFLIYRDGELNATVDENITSIQITGLSQDHNYTFTISAKNNGGEANATANTATLPNAPSPVSATALSSTEIKLTWTNTSQTVTSFRIYRKKSGSSYSLIKSGLSSSTNNYIDSDGLIAGTQYFYKIAAVNLGGESNSTEVSATTLNNVNPPSDLNATPLDSTRIKLTWRDNSNNEDYFYIYQDGAPLGRVDANITTYIVENLSPNTTYLFEVMASNNDNNSTKARVIAKTPDVPPAAPSSLSGEALSSSSIKLRWNDNSNNETGFKIYRNGSLIMTTGKDVREFTDSGLSPNTSYHYQVVATNDVGDSSAISVTVTTKDTVPTSPASLSATDITSSSVKLIWSDRSNNESGFKIYKDGNSLTTVGAGTTSYTVTSLNPNTSYNFEVRAYNSVGESSGIAILVTTKDTIPQKPSNVQATPLSSTSIKLTWNDEANNETGYRIYRDGNLIYITGPNVESYTDTFLSPNHSYTYEIKATNLAGDSEGVTVTASTNDAPPPMPTNLMAVEAGSNAVKLTWMDNSSNEKGFKIYRNGTLIKTLPADSTTFTDTTAQRNTPYTYSVSAFNDYGESQKSSYGITLSGGESFVGTKEDFVERLYKNFLGREADEDGKNHWTQLLEEGMTATRVAKNFFDSKEFKEQINPTLTDEEYITMLYHTMLNRDPDLQGMEYWKDQLATKGKTRELIFYQFALSPEFYSLSKHYGVKGFDSEDLLDNFIDRMYYLVMRRDPDDKGKNWWKEQLKSKKKKARDIAIGFFDSPEFRRRGYSDYNFITIAYRALLNREPDMEGRDYWYKQLQKGMSRHDLVMNFINSDEFKSLAVKYGIDY